MLLLPYAYSKAGYLLAPIIIIAANFFKTFAAVRLAQLAIQTKILNYPAIANLALGSFGKNLVRILTALACF